MIKLVIFDLDDTLISEEEYIKSGYTVVADYIENKYNIPKDIAFREMFKKYRNKEKNVFNGLLDENGIAYSKEEIKEIVDVYRNHVPKITFFDDVKPTISLLKEKGVFTGIISDGYRETQKNKLTVLNANEFFDKMILTEELGREYWKPNPKAFEIMQNEFGLNYCEMMYVGDNPQKDFFIKKYYPIRTVRIIRENSIYENQIYLSDIKEDVRIEKLTDILDYLK